MWQKCFHDTFYYLPQYGYVWKSSSWEFPNLWPISERSLEVIPGVMEAQLVSYLPVSEISYTLTLDADLQATRVASRGLFSENNERSVTEKATVSSTPLCVDYEVYVQVSRRMEGSPVELTWGKWICDVWRCLRLCWFVFHRRRRTLSAPWVWRWKLSRRRPTWTRCWISSLPAPGNSLWVTYRSQQEWGRWETSNTVAIFSDRK